jgi:hypothetical protein
MIILKAITNTVYKHKLKKVPSELYTKHNINKFYKKLDVCNCSRRNLYNSGGTVYSDNKVNVLKNISVRLRNKQKYNI